MEHGVDSWKRSIQETGPRRQVARTTVVVSGGDGDGDGGEWRRWWDVESTGPQ